MGSVIKESKFVQSIQTDFADDYTPNINNYYPQTQKAQLLKRETQFKILSPHSQALKDYDDNVGSAIKHTTSQLSMMQGEPELDSHLKYKFGGSSSQLFQMKEDKLLEKTLSQARKFEHHDLYENLDMKNFTNVSPNKNSNLNNNGSSNFVNFKHFKGMDRRQVRTAMKMSSVERPRLDHKSLYPYIKGSQSQLKNVQFTLTTPSKAQIFQPKVKAMAKTLLFETISQNDHMKNHVFSSFNTIQNQPATPVFQSHPDTDIQAKQQLMKRKYQTNNNYSSMLNAVAKKRKLDQLQVRFQQTVNMLPEEAKQHLRELAQQLEEVQMLEEQQRRKETIENQMKHSQGHSDELRSQQMQKYQKSQERVILQENMPSTTYQYNQGIGNESPFFYQANASQSFNMKIEEPNSTAQQYLGRTGKMEYQNRFSLPPHPSDIKNYVQSNKVNLEDFHKPPVIVNINRENPLEIAQKINILINQSQQQQKKLHDNLFNSILRIEEEKEQPNAGQKEFRVFKEKKKISKYFSMLSSQQDLLKEENFKTKNFNKATYYYQDEDDLDGVKKRKLEEQKYITDFVSERENFIIQQNRMKRIMGLAPHVQENSVEPVKAKTSSIDSISIDDFLKHNKINPKIFSADTLQHHDVSHVSSSQVKNLRPNTNKKHAAIQKIVLLIQTQKITQAKQLVIKSLKEFPGDITLLFDKGLILLMNKEYIEAQRIYESIKPQLQYKNAVLINLFLAYLRAEKFEEILELKEEIQKSETFMDYDEKNLKKIVLFAKEKLQVLDYDRYQAFIQRQKLKMQGFDTQKQPEGENNHFQSAKKSLPLQSTKNGDEFQINIEDTLELEISQYNKRHNRQWSYSKDHVHRDSLFSHAKKVQDIMEKRKSSADTERSVKQKQGQAMYIIKKSQQILKDKNQQMRQKYDQLQELYSDSKSVKSGGEKSSKNTENIFKSMTDDQILDKINKRKQKQLLKSSEKYKDAMEVLKEQQERTNHLIKQSTMNLKRKQTSKSIGRNSSEGRNQPLLQHRDSDLSVEFKEAYGKLEAEMQTSKEYFFKKLRNITSKQEDLGPQFDPVQMEYDLLIQEIDNLKKEIGGEEKLYEYITKLQNERKNRSLSNSRQNSSRERPWVEQTKEKEQDMLFQLRMKQYSRAISVLLDTKNSLFFYNGKGGSGINQNIKSSQLSGSKSKQVSSRQLSKDQSLSKISQRLDRTQSKFQADQQPQKPSHSNTMAPQRQGTIFKKFNTQQEVEESFKNIEARLGAYEQAEKNQETEDQAMMRILAINEDQLEERKNLQKGITGHILMPQSERKEIQNQRNADFMQFDAKTQEFLDYLFETYGLQQMIVADTQTPSLFKEIQNEAALNQYINQMSMFVTNRSSDLQHLHKYSKDKTKEKLKEKDKSSDGNFIDIKDHAELGGGEASEIESFQKLLEQKILEKISDKQEDESEFYAAMLQKLNTIDILQTYLKKCAKSIKSGEEQQVVKKEITFAMLQIFREQISKKELHERQRRNGIVSSMDYDDTDYDLLDKIVRRLKFFKTFDQRVRHKLYRICRYQILPPDKLIMRKEEIDEMIIVIINGTASLMVQDNQQKLTYSVSTLFPGESLGDVNLTNTLKHKDDQCQTYVKSDKECDILVFDKRQFANVLFQEMKDSLYEKIITLKNSEFFESISPYALVILCSNIEIKEFTYGDVIVRQQNEPEYCFIIVSGECKVAYETIVYKTRDEIQSIENQSNKQMHFGFQKYKPSDDYVGFKKNQVEKTHEREDKFKYQQKLNEKFSFQNDRIDVATLKKDQQAAQQSGSGVGFHSKTGSMGKSAGTDGGILSGFTKGAIQKETESKQLIAFRHHIQYDKLVQGKCFCARTLLEKDYIKKFIEREFDEFKQQLGSDFDFIKRGVSAGVQSSVKNSNSLHTREFSLYQQRQGAQSKESLMGLQPSKVSKLANPQVIIPNTDFDPYQQRRYRQMLDGSNDLSQYDPKKNDSPRLETDPIPADGKKDKANFYKKLNQMSKKSLQQSSSKPPMPSQSDVNRQRSNGVDEDMFAEGGLADKLLLGDNLKNTHENSFSIKHREQEVKFIYDQLMKSQLTVIADSASVKVIVISRKSKKYLSEPLKAVIDNKILNLKFKDYDRPFKNQSEITKFLENQKNWESFKNKLSSTNNQNQQQARLNI